MTRFSQRLGYAPAQYAFQRERMDEALRTRLWNILQLGIWGNFRRGTRTSSHAAAAIERLAQRLWVNYLNHDIDRLPAMDSTYAFNVGAYAELKRYFFNCEWFEAYDMLEEISVDRDNQMTDEVRGWLNEALSDHNAAYRFVDKTIAEITSEQEIRAIESALADARDPIREHLDLALKMLSDREAPDYRNSIKESISAVEAACRIATGDEKATLGDAVRRIGSVHPAMARAFQQLYGYTSDAAGIRHALSDGDTHPSYYDAKFMLVACSGFTSYVLGAMSQEEMRGS